jgi:hypothetical protein
MQVLRPISPIWPTANVRQSADSPATLGAHMSDVDAAPCNSTSGGAPVGLTASDRYGYQAEMLTFPL